MGKLALRVGEPHPALDQILENRGLRHYAWITAANPRSARLDEAENRARNRALAARLDGWQYLRARTVPDDGAWPDEGGFLVLGMGPEDALELARAFEQNAILVGEVGGAPALAWA